MAFGLHKFSRSLERFFLGANNDDTLRCYVN